MLSQLNSRQLTKWFQTAIDFVPCCYENIALSGSEPIREDDLSTFLNASGIEVVSATEADEETEVLIVGHEDFDTEALLHLLDLREGHSLRIYSQEMFLAHWVTGQDPFEDPDIALAFADGHEALEFIKSRWVEWPTTFLPSEAGNGSFSGDSPTIGVLKAAGYTVGATKGLQSGKRQEILKGVFQSDLRVLLPSDYLSYLEKDFPNYLSEWGYPRSSERLAKIRDCLTDFCRRQNTRGNWKAAEDYEEDLSWLNECVRTGRFKFDYSRGFVRSR